MDETLHGSKGGEEIVRVRIRRSLKDGAILTIWTHPMIEDFFKQLSLGDSLALSEYGREWKVTADMPKTVGVYSLDHGIATPRPTSTSLCQYTLESVGGVLSAVDIRRDDDDSHIINLSMLRLTGISEGLGVSFSFPHVGSSQSLVQIAENLIAGVKAFYLDHLKPVDVNLSIISTRLL